MNGDVEQQRSTTLEASEARAEPLISACRSLWIFLGGSAEEETFRPSHLSRHVLFRWNAVPALPSDNAAFCVHGARDEGLAAA